MHDRSARSLSWERQIRQLSNRIDHDIAIWSAVQEDTGAIDGPRHRKSKRNARLQERLSFARIKLQRLITREWRDVDVIHHVTMRLRDIDRLMNNRSIPLHQLVLNPARILATAPTGLRL